VPVYLVSGVFTMPEYLRTRFGGQRIRVLLSVLALLAYVFTKISADLYAGALFIKLSFGLTGYEGLYVSILILLALAAFFTIFGGLSAVIWTDFIQAILMVLGAFVLMIRSKKVIYGASIGKMLSSSFQRRGRYHGDLRPVRHSHGRARI